MTKANVQRMHSETPLYSEGQFPPMPPRIRLAAHCYERVWWLTLVDPMEQPERLSPLVNRLASDVVTVRAQMRTRRRICFAVTTNGLEEQNEFEIAMRIMAMINREIGEIERVEDRPVTMWPISDF
ncbi:hypothetical protein [Reinekea blandensis]|uniref:Uncharacterized protein n=1 Tax=Reinekea blandensis MED297 TaxID=314283 RepID=A4BBY7_9GAMM|nr:hypothetical protein [Reinekea blandensis]EAR10472.1 hypothetical protein MED297_01585 [Reinekea sp. MED297] [Reinekea blandensis MED297]